MTHALGARSESFCLHVDPELMQVVRVALAHSEVDFGFTQEQSRTRAQQQAMVKRGVSRVAPGPKARHMIQEDHVSKAVDLVPWVNGAFTWGDDQWRVKVDGKWTKPFYEIAAIMRRTAINLGMADRMRWGGVWDKKLSELPETPELLEAEVAAYAKRHAGSDLLDGPHFEIILSADEEE